MWHASHSALFVNEVRYYVILVPGKLLDNMLNFLKLNAIRHCRGHYGAGPGCCHGEYLPHAAYEVRLSAVHRRFSRSHLLGQLFRCVFTFLLFAGNVFASLSAVWILSRNVWCFSASSWLLFLTIDEVERHLFFLPWGRTLCGWCALVLFLLLIMKAFTLLNEAVGL